MFTKVIGPITISEDGGKASVSLSVSEKLGGVADGAVTASASASVTVDGKQLIDLGLELAAAKFPAISGLIDAAKAGIDAELAKV